MSKSRSIKGIIYIPPFQDCFPHPLPQTRRASWERYATCGLFFRLFFSTQPVPSLPLQPYSSLFQNSNDLARTGFPALSLFRSSSPFLCPFLCPDFLFPFLSVVPFVLSKVVASSDAVAAVAVPESVPFELPAVPDPARVSAPVAPVEFVPESEGPAPTVCTATVPPNGPEGFWHLTMHTFFTPATVPLHETPAGILATRGKSALAALLLPLLPGTLVVMIITSKLSPTAVGSTEHSMGPAPSALTWWRFIVTMPPVET